MQYGYGYSYGRIRKTKMVSYDADAQLYFDFTDGSANELTAARKGYINTFILGLKADGDYAKMDTAWIIANQNEAAAAVPIVEGGSGSTSGIWSLTPFNAPTFTQDRGYTFNGTTQYLDTQYAPSGGSLVSLNNICIGTYSRTDYQTTAVKDIGTDNSGGTYLYIRTQSGLIVTAMNDATGQTAVITDTLGLISTKRTGANATSIWQRGSSIGTSAIGSTSLAVDSLYIAASNNNGTPQDFSPKEYAFAYIGLGSINVANVYARVQTLMTNLGAAV